MNNFMEEHFVPVAAKIGSQKHLVAIRDAFIGIMPVTMAGSFAVLINAFIRDLPTQWAADAVANGNQGLADAFTSFVSAMTPIIAVNGNVWWASLAILALAVAFSLGYNLSKAYDVNPLAGGLVTFASLIATIPQSINVAVDYIDLEGNPVTSVGAWGNINWSYTQVTGVFTALIVSLICGMIYVTMMKKKIIIRMPDSVPPAVSNAFAAVIPGVTAIYVAGLATYLVSTFGNGAAINDLINTYIQKPLLGLSQGLISVIVVSIFVQLFWFFGLHGTNVLGPILDTVYKPALFANLAHFQTNGTTADMPYIWTRGSFDAYSWMGGAGCSLALIIALLIFSKREDQKTVAKLGAPMGLFNINEPVVFGLPLVLNPVYAIPFIFIPTILIVIGYLVTAAGLVPPVFIEVTWVMPPVIYAFLATGGSFAAALLSAFNLVLGVVLWAPFVMMANKVGIDE